MPYNYGVYSVQDEQRTRASMDKIHAMEADGWTVHTVSCNFAELCIFWAKPAAAPEPAADPAQDDAPELIDLELTEEDKQEPVVVPPAVFKGKQSSGNDGFSAS